MNPRLIENIWTIPTEGDKLGVTSPYGDLRIDRGTGEIALAVRTHCTGYNDIATIAQRSGLSDSDVTEAINAYAEAGLLASEPAPGPVDLDTVHEALIAITKLWSDELARDYIGSRLATGEYSREILVGWLLEMYHYVCDFPADIGYAAYRASTHAGGLASTLGTYASQEAGHEIFLSRTLQNLGFTRPEIVGSVPLVSTRNIGRSIRALADIHPATILLVASLVEAQDHNPGSIAAYQNALHHHYGIPGSALDPYFEHQAIDHALGHAQLLYRHLDLFRITSRDTLDRIVDGLHDLKHAFDLQALEIVQYYGGVANGRYLPRQPVTFSAIERPRQPVSA